MADNLFLNSIGPTIRTSLDLRRRNEPRPVSVIVTFRQKRIYCKTGERVTDEQYENLLKAKTTSSSPSSKTKTKIEKMHMRVYGVVDELVNMTSGNKGLTFINHFKRITEEKKTLKTKISYKTSLISYLKSLGATRHKLYDCKGKERKEQRLEIPEKALHLMPGDISSSSISRWLKKLKSEGKSNATIAIYTRPPRHVLRILHKEGVIRILPEISIPSGTRRTENFLSVKQILRLMEYTGKHEYARDMWLMLYLCNGCNARDLISLIWEESYFQNSELSFIRSKTHDRSPSLVLIPITSLLKVLLNRHASKPQKGEALFPELLGGAKTSEEFTQKADRLNSTIRIGMKHVCKATGIPRATAAWARNSYITALTWHGISDAFIDNMTGHVGSNSVLRGYQGRISPARRMKINSLLLVPPEE